MGRVQVAEDNRKIFAKLKKVLNECENSHPLKKDLYLAVSHIYKLKDRCEETSIRIYVSLV